MDVLSVFALLLCFIVMLFLVVGTAIALTEEKEVWNEGKCETCNTKWKHFDTASDGSRGYICSCGNYHHCWISFKVDK